MAWRCPVCQSVIRHQSGEPALRAGKVYRCHVCRVALEYRPTLDKLVITSVDADHAPPVDPKVARVRPVRPRRK